MEHINYSLRTARKIIHIYFQFIYSFRHFNKILGIIVEKNQLSHDVSFSRSPEGPDYFEFTGSFGQNPICRDRGAENAGRMKLIQFVY